MFSHRLPGKQNVDATKALRVSGDHGGPVCGSSQGRSGKVRLWKALSCSSLTGPRGLSPQSLFLGPQLRGQVKQRRQEPGRLPEDHAETQALLPRRQDAERGRRKRREGGSRCSVPTGEHPLLCKRLSCCTHAGLILTKAAREEKALTKLENVHAGKGSPAPPNSGFRCQRQAPPPTGLQKPRRPSPSPTPLPAGLPPS